MDCTHWVRSIYYTPLSQSLPSLFEALPAVGTAMTFTLTGLKALAVCPSNTVHTGCGDHLLCAVITEGELTLLSLCLQSLD